MGLTASPGRLTTSEIDHIASRAGNVIVPFPVGIRIITKNFLCYFI